MWSRAKNDLRAVYVQAAGGIIAAGVIAIFALSWAPARTLFTANLSLPVYGHVLVGLGFLSLAMIVFGYRSRRLTEIYENTIRNLQVQAATDSLTGILDYKAFGEMLRREYAKVKEQVSQGETVDFSLVLIDIDNFKEVNTLYGHSAGDAVLASFAAVLKSHLRPSDHERLGKYKGGDEFGIALPGTKLIDAREGVAERLRREVERHKFEIKHGNETLTVSVTASAGVTALQAASAEPTVVEPISEFIERADLALHQAKDAGRNNVRRLP